MFLLAGNGGNGPAVPSSEMSMFNVMSTSWLEKVQLREQSFPNDWDRMAVASYEEVAYVFGGNVRLGNSQQLQKSLYCLNLESLVCSEVPVKNIVESPSAREASAMVHCGQKLALYGGYVGTQAPSDELFTYDLKTSEAYQVY